MNNVIISGNLVRDVELRTAPSGMSIARMTVAVQRKFKDKQTGKYESDFINCLAFDKRAETIAKFFSKGSKVLFQGTWQTGSYDNKDGIKVYTNELLVENFDFIGGNNNNNNADSNNLNTNNKEGYDSDFGTPDYSDDSMPF